MHHQDKSEEIARQARFENYKKELDDLINQVIPKFERIKIIVKKMMSKFVQEGNALHAESASRKPTRSRSRLPSTPRSRRSPS